MTSGVERRFDRLRSVLPGIYDTRPGKALGLLDHDSQSSGNGVEGASKLAIVLLRVACELARMDEAQRRTLHDRWLPLALDQSATEGSPTALDRLGALVDVTRLRGPAMTEASESFRHRIATTARALSGGPGTPRTLLSLVLAAIGTEPCPRIRTRYAAAPWAVEATSMRGMPPGTRRRCAACRSGHAGNIRNDEPTGCPKDGGAPLAEAFLLENPVTPKLYQENAIYWKAFELESRSLTTDRPVIRLRPSGDLALRNPAVQNRATGETVLFHGSVEKGQTLILFPAMAQEELEPFDGPASEAHHSWLDRHGDGQRASNGRAELHSDAEVNDVSDNVYFLSGSRFDDLTSTYAGPQAEAGIRFAVMQRFVRTPRLRPGADPWRLLEFAPDNIQQDNISAALDASSGAESGTDDMHAVFRLLQRAEERAAAAPPGKAVATLELEWLVRPPATVRLCLLRSTWVDQAMAMGAVERLRQDIDLARPAGVRVLFEIREPSLPRDVAELSELGPIVRTAATLREDAAPEEKAPVLVARVPLARETHDLDDQRLGWNGRFDVTRFDWAKLE